MFCPKCGAAEQTQEAFCRRCGTYLPNLEKLAGKEISPETHFKANTLLTFMSAVVSLGLAIALYSVFLGRPDTPILIYVTAGFLTAMFAWQVQVIWRTRLLKKQFPGLNNFAEKGNESSEKNFAVSVETGKLLETADFSNVVPASVTEHTTGLLVDASKAESSKPKH
jgi:hypothetical protein